MPEKLATRQQILHYRALTYILSLLDKRQTGNLSYQKEERLRVKCPNPKIFAVMSYICTLAVRGRQSAAMMPTALKSRSISHLEYILAVDDSDQKSPEPRTPVIDPSVHKQHATHAKVDVNMTSIPEMIYPATFEDFFTILVRAIRPETQLSTAKHIGQLRAFLTEFAKRAGQPFDMVLTAKWSGYVIFSCLDNIRSRVHRDWHTDPHRASLSRSIWDRLTTVLPADIGPQELSSAPEFAVVTSTKVLSTSQKSFFVHYNYGDLDSVNVPREGLFYTCHSWKQFHNLLRVILRSCDKALEHLQMLKISFGSLRGNLRRGDVSTIERALMASLQAYDRLWAFEKSFRGFIGLHLLNLEKFFSLKYEPCETEVDLEDNFEQLGPTDDQDEALDLEELRRTSG